MALSEAAQAILARWDAERRLIEDAWEAGRGAPGPWSALTLGTALRLLRRRLRLKQWELARRMDARQSFVSKIERGADIHLSTLRRYLDALGCDLVILPRPRRGLEATATRLRLEGDYERAQGLAAFAEALADLRGAVPEKAAQGLVPDSPRKDLPGKVLQRTVPEQSA